jgi:hypothetical protein
MKTTLKEELQKIGWSDELIQHFTRDDNVDVRIVVTSDLLLERINIQQDFFDMPKKIDSTTFVV